MSCVVSRVGKDRKRRSDSVDEKMISFVATNGDGKLKNKTRPVRVAEETRRVRGELRRKEAGVKSKSGV